MALWNGWPYSPRNNGTKAPLCILYGEGLQCEKPLHPRHCRRLTSEAYSVCTTPSYSPLITNMATDPYPQPRGTPGFVRPCSLRIPMTLLVSHVLTVNIQTNELIKCHESVLGSIVKSHLFFLLKQVLVSKINFEESNNRSEFDEVFVKLPLPLSVNSL